MDAAERVIAAHGHQAASVKAISAEAGVATGALYRHFPSKAALFAQVLRRVGERELAALERAAARHDDPVDGLLAGLATFAARAQRAPRLAGALLHEPADPLVDAERLAYRRRHRAALAERVAAGVAQGDLPPQDPQRTAAALVGAWAEVVVDPLAPDQDGEPAGGPAPEALEALVAIAARAIGAPQRRHPHEHASTEEEPP